MRAVRSAIVSVAVALVAIFGGVLSTSAAADPSLPAAIHAYDRDIVHFADDHRPSGASARSAARTTYAYTDYDRPAQFAHVDCIGATAQEHVGGVDRELSSLARLHVATTTGAGARISTLGEVNAIVPEGQTLGSWGQQIWGMAPRGPSR